MHSPGERTGSNATDGDSGIDIETDAVEDAFDVEPSAVESPDTLIFAKNVFLPLTTACRYTCTYCTFFDPPGEASLISLDDVREVLRQGANAGCTEALFTFGDKPDDRYSEIHAQLDEWGYDSIHEYLCNACQVALDEGLLPHSNPGDLTYETMERLASVNASMGVMLETTADVDAHAGPRQKTPSSGFGHSGTRGSFQCRSRPVSTSASEKHGVIEPRVSSSSNSFTNSTDTYRKLSFRTSCRTTARSSTSRPSRRCIV
jgi:hypothetical protein